MNPLFLIDFHKVGHVSQYPPGVKKVYTNWTPRSTRTTHPGVVHFGLQYFIKKYLIKEFNENFFHRPWPLVRDQYVKLIRATLGVKNPKIDHIQELHELGYLPVEIYALPEGTLVPYGVPALVMVNTDDRFFWLPNYLETILSNILWKPSTSATTALEYRKIFTKWAKEFGETDFGPIDYMGHDFSFRGMGGVEDAILSGLGHLTSFKGTDTVPAIWAAQEYYGADLSVGGSVPATEHSVMCAGTQEGELETFKRLLETYPKGVLSIVSDTWDLWKVLTQYLPELKEKILARDGVVVIRPDSGDPVKIICGDSEARERKDFNPSETGTCLHPSYYGVLRLLRYVFGATDGRLNKVAAIYGDAITLERADEILRRTVWNQNLSPYNVVFGIGSYTYVYKTRDTYGFAMKATAIETDEGIIPIFKKPVTDDGGKTSHKGIPITYQTPDGQLAVRNSLDPDDLDDCAFRLVYRNGGLAVEERFDVIRKRVQALCE